MKYRELTHHFEGIGPDCIYLHASKAFADELLYQRVDRVCFPLIPIVVVSTFLAVYEIWILVRIEDENIVQQDEADRKPTSSQKPCEHLVMV
jgi:hypothetical protein